jgi:hypothetical protein
MARPLAAMFAGAAVFVGSDETMIALENQPRIEALRRLLMRLGGANIASADRASELRRAQHV